MQSEAPDTEEPIPLSVRGTSTRRKRWSSAPPPPMPRRRSRVALTLFGAMWLAIGAASIAYVAHRSDNVATTEAR